MDANQIKSQFPGYQGWNDSAAIVADFKATGGQGKGPSRSSSPSFSSGISLPQATIDPIETAQKLRQFNIDSNQPAIQSLQSSIPEVSQKYNQSRDQLSAQREPLKQRYQSVIDSLKGNQVTSENRQTNATRNELANRGIYGGGYAEQEMVNALNPITSEYSNRIKDTSAQQELGMQGLDNLIANLAPQEVEQTRAIQNAIAALQAGEPSSAIQSALALTGQNQQINAQNSQLELQRQAQALAEKTYNQVTLPQSQYELNRPYYKPETTSSGSGLGLLQQLLGGGSGISEPKPSSPYSRPSSSTYSSGNYLA